MKTINIILFIIIISINLYLLIMKFIELLNEKISNTFDIKVNNLVKKIKAS